MIWEPGKSRKRNTLSKGLRHRQMLLAVLGRSGPCGLQVAHSFGRCTNTKQDFVFLVERENSERIMRKLLQFTLLPTRLRVLLGFLHHSTPSAEHLRQQLSPAGIGLEKRNDISFISEMEKLRQSN